MGVEDRITTGRTEEEYYAILRDRIIECVCHEVTADNNLEFFHGVDMVRRCVGGFLNKEAADQYEFSGEHEYYKHALERIYRPLIDLGLLSESENNNYWPRLREICRKELSNKSYIIWDDFLRTARR
jgi:hypothetical protein